MASRAGCSTAARPAGVANGQRPQQRAAITDITAARRQRWLTTTTKPRRDEFHVGAMAAHSHATPPKSAEM